MKLSTLTFSGRIMFEDDFFRLRYLNARRTDDPFKYDDWGVELWLKSESTADMPNDLEYFTDVQAFGKIFGGDKVYDLFVKVYNEVPIRGQNEEAILPKASVFQMIRLWTFDFNEYAKHLQIWMSVLYMAMIAEENKKGKILGKRIKRLGIYQILFEGLLPKQAANFSKGKRFYELDEIMQKLNF